MAVIVLDYDGTLHESMAIYGPAVRHAVKCVAGMSAAEVKALKDEDISCWLGFTSKEMWDSFLPDLSEGQKKACETVVGREMTRLIQEGQAKLYPSTIKVLAELKKSGHTLVLLSNCKHNYMVEQIKLFRLNNYFDSFYCSEDYRFASKSRIFELIRKRYSDVPLEDFVIIGDRAKDIEVAQTFDLFSIGCLYGYGSEEELQNASVLCESITDLPQLIAER